MGRGHRRPHRPRKIGTRRRNREPIYWTTPEPMQPGRRGAREADATWGHGKQISPLGQLGTAARGGRWDQPRCRGQYGACGAEHLWGPRLSRDKRPL